MAEVTYTARLTGPVIIEKGRTNTVSCPIYRDGRVIVPSIGVLTIWNAADVKVVDAVSVTVNATTGFAEYALLSATLEGQEFSSGWRFEWGLMLDSELRTFRAFGSLVYRRLYPVVSDLDLEDRHHELPRRLKDAKKPSLQSYLDQAWAEVEGRLVKTGKRPFLILDPSALRDVHLYLALALAFDDLSSAPDSVEDDRGDKYRGRYHDAWNELTFPQAAVDGTPERGLRRAGRPAVWLCSRS